MRQMIIYNNKIRSLGTFFTKVKNAEKLEAFLKSQDVLSEEIFRSLYVTYSRSPFDITPSVRRGWLKLEIGNKVGEEGSFYLLDLTPVRLPEGEELVEIGSLSDTIDPDKSTIYIEDSKLHIKSTATGYQLMLHKSEDYTLIENKTMYADYHGVNTYHLYKRFGAVIGAPRRKDSLKYLIELRAIWRALMEKTSKQYLLEALTAVLGLPMAYESGTVVEVGTGFITIKYDNLGYVSHIHSQLKTFNVGDTVTQFEPLTDLIKVYDADDTYFAGLLSELSDKLKTDVIETRIVHKNGFSYVYLDYLPAGPGNVMLIDTYRPVILEVVEDTIQIPEIVVGSGVMELTGRFAKIEDASAVFSNGQKVKAAVAPSYNQLYQYAKKMIFLVQIFTEVAVAETGAMEDFVNLYEPLHHYIFVSFANYFLDSETPPKINVSDTTTSEYSIDATERVNRHILSVLGGDQTNIYDTITIQ